MARVSPVTSAETTDHHGSHRHLLWPSGDPGLARGVDAIIVPTARPPAYLAEAAALARSLPCTLVTLHSKQWTSAAKAAQRLPADIDRIAIDIPDAAHLRLPDWETSRLLARTVFARRTDLSAKRNLALVLGRMLGWERVLFLDDDITKLNPDDVRRASGLLSTHIAVGLHVGGFPDHSVVCHAYRQAGGSQQSFIGGGALAVDPKRANSFFPDIYNDDWFFLLGDKGIQSVGVTGTVWQSPYDPFRTPDRARAEELGDVLAEGIYWLLDQDRSIIDANEKYWAKFLTKRERFIKNVVRMVQQDTTLEPADQARRVAALRGSLGRLALITPTLCDSYLRAWLTDRQHWDGFLEEQTILDIQQLPEGERCRAALASLARPGSPGLTWQFGGRGKPVMSSKDAKPFRIHRRPSAPRAAPHRRGAVDDFAVSELRDPGVAVLVGAAVAGDPVAVPDNGDVAVGLDPADRDRVGWL
jgi:hypothetical protein